MDLEIIREYCLSRKGVTEGFPFDDETLVFKVMGKMFCLGNLTPPFSINLKCDPEKAIELREQHDCVIPGYHMNKTHWNTIQLDGSVEDKVVLEWISDSYDLVVIGLKKKEKEYLKNLT